ncbi:MAG: heme-binding protein [Pseudomonadota bacterium]
MKFLNRLFFTFGLAVMLQNAALATDSSYTIKLMTPETALKAALAGMKECRSIGYQVAIAVVDRTGQTQVVLRDRFAGMHTIEAATNKAWTAVSFKTNTSQFATNTQSGKESSGIRSISKVLALGGGMMVDAGGNLYGAIGVSGAPSGDEDDKCTKAAIASIMEDLEM